MPLTPDELELEREALRRIRHKLLPAEAPKTIRATLGSGKACALCDQAIEPTETEYEISNWVHDGTEKTLHFHPRCQELWQLGVAHNSAR